MLDLRFCYDAHLSFRPLILVSSRSSFATDATAFRFAHSRSSFLMALSRSLRASSWVLNLSLRALFSSLILRCWSKRTFSSASSSRNFSDFSLVAWVYQSMSSLKLWLSNLLPWFCKISSKSNRSPSCFFYLAFFSSMVFVGSCSALKRLHIVSSRCLALVVCS